MFYEALNSTNEEQQRMVGYVLGDILFGYMLSAGAGKVADVAGDFSKGAKAAIEVTTDGKIVLKGQYADDAAKYIDDLADGAKYADDVADVAKNLDTIFLGGKVSVDDLMANPKVFSGKSVNEIADALTDAGYKVNIRDSNVPGSKAQIIEILNNGNGKNIAQVQVSPGAGRHELPYVKISTTNQGKIKVIDGPRSAYKTDGKETAILIFSEGE